MESKEKGNTWYLTVYGEKVEVSESVYREARRCNNHVRNMALAEHRCAQTNFSHCGGDCGHCPWTAAGRIESLSDSNVQFNAAFVSGDNPEEDVLTRITMERVYGKANELVRDGAAILRLKCEYSLSAREIAKELGVSHATVNERMAKLIRYFREHEKNFF